jgi:hypothetical protein
VLALRHQLELGVVVSGDVEDWGASPYIVGQTQFRRSARNTRQVPVKQDDLHLIAGSQVEDCFADVRSVSGLLLCGSSLARMSRRDPNVKPASCKHPGMVKEPCFAQP